MAQTSAVSMIPRGVAVLGESRYGTPEPAIEVRLPGKGYRLLNATLHRVAAAVELATPLGERWVVQIEAYDDDCGGRVSLELSKGTKAEAERGMAVLRTAVIGCAL